MSEYLERTGARRKLETPGWTHPQMDPNMEATNGIEFNGLQIEDTGLYMSIRLRRWEDLYEPYDHAGIRTVFSIALGGKLVYGPRII